MFDLKASRKTLYMDGSRGSRNRELTTCRSGLLTHLTIALLVVAATLAGTFGTPSARAESVAADANKELEAGHFQAACQLYRLSLATHRSDVTILLNAARAYEGAGDLDEAIRRAREATVFEPNNADAHLALGHCLDINREEKAAILQFEIVLDLKKADSSTRKAAYGPLLRLLKHEAAWDKLVKTARRGAHEFPQDPDSHFNLGWALSQSPQAAPKDVPKVQREAVSEYQKSIELGERRPAVHLNLATLLADIGDSAAASESLSNYLKLAPTEASRSEVKALSAKIGGKI